MQVLNSIPTVDDIVVYYRTQARLLEEYCAKLMDIDLATFQKEAQSYNEAVSILEDAANERELNFALRTVCTRPVRSPSSVMGSVSSKAPCSLILFSQEFPLM